MDNRRGKPRARCKLCTVEDTGDYQKSRPEETKAYHAQYYIEHIEHHNAITKRYYEEHTEETNARSLKWNRDNPDRSRENNHANYMANRDRIQARHNQWDVAHPELKRLYSIRYRQSHPDRVKAQQSVYYSSQPGKLSIRRHNIKRRQLGFIPLNSDFDGADFHHLRILKNGTVNDDVGLFIPSELHHSVPHNRTQSKNNYDKINELALSWVLQRGHDDAMRLIRKIGWPELPSYAKTPTCAEVI